MNFSEQLPSKQWKALTLRGVRIAEVWFKPDGEPLALAFRIPRSSFHIPGIGQRLTIENLLKAVAIANDAVESCGGASPDEPDPELTTLLPPPPHDDSHLEIHVRLKPPSQAVGHEVAPTKWHDLEARWKTLLSLEATLDTTRNSVESIRAELESSLRRTLTAEEKLHAHASDVAQWSKVKSRAHYALPKASEFIHRATWAAGTPERKRLGEIFKDSIETQTPQTQADEVLHELEILRKDRQVLSAQGVTVYQECKGISTDVQGALRRLQSNAAVKASKKKGGTGAKGKSY